MKKLKNIVFSNSRKLATYVMMIILCIILLFQILSVQKQAQNNAKAIFYQVGQIIHENQTELISIEQEYRETCLLNAETISYIIQHNPDILGDVEEFRLLAKKLQIDEIHIFDKSGRIFTGTHPEYYDYTFDSGEQMNFFKPMLQDKTLRLCQEIMPNTAEAKLVQYSALWSDDGKYIIQVGMYPDAVLAATEKNELSYIFSLLQGNPGVSLYAIDANDGIVIGSTVEANNGKHYQEIGFSDIDTEHLPRPLHLSINGTYSYCLFEDVHDFVIAYAISASGLYSSIFSYTLMLILCLIIIAFVLIFAVQKFTDEYIISSIDVINEKLRSVSKGNLDEHVDVKTSLEFSELSSHINRMMTSLLSSTDKMSYVLNYTNILMGVYEYGHSMKRVRFTDHIPQIFGLETGAVKELATDCERMQQFIEQIKQNPVSGMENTYCITGKEERYIKLEEVTNGNDVLGIVIDVTDEVVSLKEAQKERDMDALTGLYNRRGMDRVFDRLFYKDRAELGCGALIVIDLDDMKIVNDTYGHSAGDAYLQGYAKMLQNFKAPKSVAARSGGDEFVLFVYGYKSNEEIDEAFSSLRQIQDSDTIALEGGIKVTMHFSFGYQLIGTDKDYIMMLASADEFMYNSKRLRKKLAAEKKRES